MHWKCESDLLMFVETCNTNVWVTRYTFYVSMSWAWSSTENKVLPNNVRCHTTALTKFHWSISLSLWFWKKQDTGQKWLLEQWILWKESKKIKSGKYLQQVRSVVRPAGSCHSMQVCNGTSSPAPREIGSYCTRQPQVHSRSVIILTYSTDSTYRGPRNWLQGKLRRQPCKIGNMCRYKNMQNRVIFAKCKVQKLKQGTERPRAR